jgi:hypothetical protein
MSAILNVLPLPRGRRPELEKPRSLSLFPKRSDGRPHLYAIAFKGGVVKVGISSSPRERILDHWRRASGEVEWVHLFTKMHPRTARNAERAAVTRLRRMGSQVNGSEWFRGDLQKQVVIEAIRECISESRAFMQRNFEDEIKALEREKAAAQILRDAGMLQEAKSFPFWLLHGKAA